MPPEVVSPAAVFPEAMVPAAVSPEVAAHAAEPPEAAGHHLRVGGAQQRTFSLSCHSRKNRY